MSKLVYSLNLTLPENMSKSDPNARVDVLVDETSGIVFQLAALGETYVLTAEAAQVLVTMSATRERRSF